MNDPDDVVITFQVTVRADDLIREVGLEDAIRLIGSNLRLEATNLTYGFSVTKMDVVLSNFCKY